MKSSTRSPRSSRDLPCLLLPPRVHDACGARREVGVEIEFNGLSLETVCEIIVAFFGGRARRVHEYSMVVEDSGLGAFHVTVDSHALNSFAERRKRKRPLSLFAHAKELWLAAFAGYITPLEIATPPLPFERLFELDALTRALCRAGAHGTRDSLFYVFGVHFNPTVPSADPRVLLDFIRAYLLSHDFLVRALRVDLTRRVMRFATPYPAAYARLVLDSAYDPDLGRLIDDYLAHNPTRDRALDLLPLFAHLDAPRVRAVIDDDRIKPRPTFHFRLPNSAITSPGFRISDEWRLWLEVERLAGDRARLLALCARARRRLQWPLCGMHVLRGLLPARSG